MSLKATVNGVMKKKGVRSVEIEKAKGGYVTNTRHHDYEKPTEVGVHKNVASVAKHLKACWGEDMPDQDKNGGQDQD